MCFKFNFSTIIGNCRFYPAPPTSMTNVYTVLMNIKKMECRHILLIVMKPFIKYAKKFSGRQKTNLTTWYSVWEVSTLRKISLALLENEWTEVGHFFSGHHPHGLSIVE